jgi:MoaA/NifB/PqqE/SkfB family radical SAM enzyme
MHNNDIKILHIESTSACNAKCPQCAREIDPNFKQVDVKHLTVANIKKLFDVDFIKNLDKMFMCGNYGDPAAGKHTLEIFEYFRSVNQSITLGMNTNGGIRSPSWWKTLAQVLNQPKDYVVWSIDGLEDTNHLYRINVSWNKVIKNANAFISSGGNAHWDMLTFEHNQHQIKDAELYAKQLGFKWFRVKVSNRHEIAPVSFLSKPAGWQAVNHAGSKISCRALLEKSLYVAADGTIFPCCWLGSLDPHTIEEFDSIKQSWVSDTPNSTCKFTCSTNDTDKTNFTNQWQYEVELC